MAAFNSLAYLIYSILTLTANNKPATDPALSAWEVESETQATETWNQEHYVTRNYDAEKCPAGEKWSDCDAGCETTCETVGQPTICPRICIPGCVCDRPGEVRGPNKQCIAPPLCPKEPKKTCDERPETGLCRGRFPMWYYDDRSSDCKQFIYGGCGGNGNRYKTKGECLKNCAYIWPDSEVRKTYVERCEQPSETGLCHGHIPRFYFDKEAGQCKEFIYGGCGGNENNFKTEEECQKACGNHAAWEVGTESETTETWNQEDYVTRNYDAEKCPAGEKWSDCNGGCETTCETVGQPLICPRICIPGCVCDRPGEVRGPNKQCIAPPLCPKGEKKTCDDKPETGLCKGFFPMWYYDDSSSDCKKFIYGGCGGNGNRYKTKGECLKNCANIWPDSEVRKTEVDKCAQPSEFGLCHGHIPRFYFDKEVGQCKEFIYGGCGGNENNFKTEEECQQACGNHHAVPICRANERYNECATACPLTCENYKNPPEVCPLKCFRGCECKEGFVMRGDGKCVKPEQCPKPKASEEDCPANKEWGSYGDCPDSCWALKNPIRPCTIKLNWGCKCKKGYVLREDKVYTSDCIKPEECPS